MDYRCNMNGTVAEVKISGRLTFEEHTKIRTLISELENMGGKEQVIDLKDVDFIDSAGLGLLLRIKSMGEKSGVQTRLRVADGGQVQNMMQVSQFNRLIPVED